MLVMGPVISESHRVNKVISSHPLKRADGIKTAFGKYFTGQQQQKIMVLLVNA